MTNDERRPTGLLHSADELRQLIRENPTLPLIVFAGMLEDINPNEIVSHILDGTLLSWLASWKMKSQMLVAFLLENEKARLSEKD